MRNDSHVCIELCSLWDELKKKIQASPNETKEAHGFGRCTHLYTGGGPIHHDTVKYFMSLGMPIISTYGMSEATAAISKCTIAKSASGSCGTSSSGREIKICNPNRHGVGEVSYCH